MSTRKIQRLFSFGKDVFWSRQIYGRWGLVVPLSDKVRLEVQLLRQTPRLSIVEDGNIATAKITPCCGLEGKSFIAVN